MKTRRFNLRNIFFLIPVLLLMSCGSNENSTEYAELKTEMDSIASISQKELLKNVSAAIKNGGTEYAVGFCNVMAMPIVDSLSEAYDVQISRVTDKTRNPKNGLKTEDDKLVFQQFIENPALKDSLIKEGKEMVYYKRINTALPACIKCHGNPGSDIEPKTLAKIKSLYPNDQATGYGIDQLRGLWRIEKKK